MDSPVFIADVAISYGSFMERNGKDCKVCYKCVFPERKEAKGMAQRSMFQTTAGEITVITKL